MEEEEGKGDFVARKVEDLYDTDIKIGEGTYR